MGDAPCIRGTRIPVATIVASLLDGMTLDELLEDFHQLTDVDIAEALDYAASAGGESEAPPRPME